MQIESSLRREPPVSANKLQRDVLCIHALPGKAVVGVFEPQIAQGATEKKTVVDCVYEEGGGRPHPQVKAIVLLIELSEAIGHIQRKIRHGDPQRGQPRWPPTELHSVATKKEWLWIQFQVQAVGLGGCVRSGRSSVGAREPGRGEEDENGKYDNQQYGAHD